MPEALIKQMQAADYDWREDYSHAGRQALAEILTGLADPLTMGAIRRVASATEAVVVELNAEETPPNDIGDPAAFAAAFERYYGHSPSRDAFTGYRAARLVDQTVRALGGDLSERQALRAALAAAGAR